MRASSASSTRKPWVVTGMAVFLSVLIASPVTAQDEKERKTKQTVAMSQPVYDSLMEIQEFVETEDFANAQINIKKLQEKKRLSPYEAAQIRNNIESLKKVSDSLH